MKAIKYSNTAALLLKAALQRKRGSRWFREGIPIAYVEMVQFHRQFDWRLIDLTFTSRPDRENWDDGSEKPITFEYFSAPPSEMDELRSARKECAFCGQMRSGFSLGGNTRLGCAECLRTGKFTFWHGTENGILHERDEIGADVPGVTSQARIALSRTPRFRSAQQEEWLICCEDFMVYLGDWTPAHFHYIAPDGDGRALFQRIAGDECRSWWDKAPIRLLGGHSPSSWGDSNCHVFRCRHCRKFRLYFAFY